MQLDDVTSWFSGNQIASTLVLVASFFVLRKLAEKLLRGSTDFIPDDRRRLISLSRNTLVLILVIGLIMIWAPALRTFALSVTAFLVALVLATKELILCITGGLLRTSTGSFSVGDWVRIGDQRGEVIDQSILSVTLQELETPTRGHHFTGRTITLPNSVFLTATVVNENFFKKFVYHTVEVTLDTDDDAVATATLMEEAMTRAIADSREVSRRYNALVKKRAGVAMPTIDPRSRLATTPEGRARIAVTAFMPTGDTERVERTVVSEVLAAVHRSRDRVSLPAPPN